MPTALLNPNSLPLRVLRVYFRLHDKASAVDVILVSARRMKVRGRHYGETLRAFKDTGVLPQFVLDLYNDVLVAEQKRILGKNGE